eukprot:UN24016
MNLICLTLCYVTDFNPAITFGLLCQLMRLNDHGISAPRRPEMTFEENDKTDLKNCSYYPPRENGVQGYGLRYMYSPCLPAAVISFLLFDQLVGAHCPKVHDLFIKGNITPELFASEWFFTLFVYLFKEKELPVLYSIWDLFFLDGYVTLFKVGLALLDRSYDNIKNCDYSDTVLYLKFREKDNTPFLTKDEKNSRSGVNST